MLKFNLVNFNYFGFSIFYLKKCSFELFGKLFADLTWHTLNRNGNRSELNKTCKIIALQFLILNKIAYLHICLFCFIFLKLSNNNQSSVFSIFISFQNTIKHFFLFNTSQISQDFFSNNNKNNDIIIFDYPLLLAICNNFEMFVQKINKKSVISRSDHSHTLIHLQWTIEINKKKNKLNKVPPRFEIRSRDNLIYNSWNEQNTQNKVPYCAVPSKSS